LIIEVIENGQSEMINITQEKALPKEKFQDYFCCENILALVYPHECIFYNWKQREVLLVEKVNKPVLIPSVSNTMILKSNVNIQSYQIKQGVEKLSSTKLQQKQDVVRITPNGQHVVIVEMKKMLQLFRIGDLKAEIGQYSMYGEVEKISFTDDSAYVVLGVADTRLFFMMICDVKIKEHEQRAMSLIKKEFPEEEKKVGRVLVAQAGNEGDSSDEEGEADSEHIANLNTLVPHYLDKLMNMAEQKAIIRNLNQGYRPLRAVRAAKTKKKVAASHQLD